MKKLLTTLILTYLVISGFSQQVCLDSATFEYPGNGKWSTAIFHYSYDGKLINYVSSGDDFWYAPSCVYYLPSEDSTVGFLANTNNVPVNKVNKYGSSGRIISTEYWKLYQNALTVVDRTLYFYNSLGYKEKEERYIWGNSALQNLHQIEYDYYPDSVIAVHLDLYNRTFKKEKWVTDSPYRFKSYQYWMEFNDTLHSWYRYEFSYDGLKLDTIFVHDETPWNTSPPAPYSWYITYENLMSPTGKCYAMNVCRLSDTNYINVVKDRKYYEFDTLFTIFDIWLPKYTLYQIWSFELPVPPVATVAMSFNPFMLKSIKEYYYSSTWVERQRWTHYYSIYAGNPAIEETPKIKVFPNPTADVVNIDGEFDYIEVSQLSKIILDRQC